MTLWWIEQEPSAEDAERTALALAPTMRRCISTLLQLELLPNDRDLMQALARRPDAELTAERRHWVRQTLWRYRRRLPADIRPKANPDDPIVRAMEEAGV
jgi:hypothetical protein